MELNVARDDRVDDSQEERSCGRCPRFFIHVNSVRMRRNVASQWVSYESHVRHHSRYSQLRRQVADNLLAECLIPKKVPRCWVGVLFNRSTRNHPPLAVIRVKSDLGCGGALHCTFSGLGAALTQHVFRCRLGRQTLGHLSKPLEKFRWEEPLEIVVPTRPILT